jgi:iron complex outermembrane receptor protein
MLPRASLLLGVILLARTAAAAESQRELVDLSLEELSNLLVTTVARRPEALQITPSAVQVITADDIRRSGATRIAEALRLASNLQVAQLSSDGWAVSARGFNSALANKLLVMIDGRSIYSPLFAGTFWEAHDVPLYDVERIEIISGPGGTLWGANAVNGVINIITRPASDSQGLLLRAGGGNELRGAGALRYGGAIGESAHYRFYGQQAQRDGVKFSNGMDARNGSEIGQAGFRMDWKVSQLDAITLQGDANESRTDQAVLDDAVARSENVLARWTRSLSGSDSLQLQAYYDRAYRLSPGAYRDQLNVVDAELQHQFRAGSAHNVVWGLTYRHIRDHFTGAAFSMDPADVSLRRIGGFAQDEITLTPDRLYLTLGAKAEDNEYTDVEWQPSVSLAWRFHPNRLLWGSVSRAVRTPSRLDTALDNGTRSPFTLGNENMRSENLVAYELGLKTQPARSTSLSIATYYNDYEDLRSFERVNPASAIPLMVSNGLEGRSYGAELTVEYRPGTRWRLWGGYSYLDLDLDRKPGSTDPTGGAVEARDSRYQTFLRGSFDLNADWEIDGALRRIGGIDNQDVPPYTELNLRLGWRIADSLELSLLGSNLLHSEHGEFGPPGRLMIERAAYAQITWSPK